MNRSITIFYLLIGLLAGNLSAITSSERVFLISKAPTKISLAVDQLLTLKRFNQCPSEGEHILSRMSPVEPTLPLVKERLYNADQQSIIHSYSFRAEKPGETLLIFSSSSPTLLSRGHFRFITVTIEK